MDSRWVWAAPDKEQLPERASALALSSPTPRVPGLSVWVLKRVPGWRPGASTAAGRGVRVWVFLSASAPGTKLTGSVAVVCPV